MDLIIYILLLIIWLGGGLVIGSIWDTEGKLEDLPPLKWVVVLIICGPIFDVIILGAWTCKKVGDWL